MIGSLTQNKQHYSLNKHSSGLAVNSHEKFFELVKRAAKSFRRLKLGNRVRVVSHLDADGISSASILASALQKLSIEYEITILAQLSKAQIQKLRKTKEITIIFLDLGSGSTKEISKTLSEKKVVILDHHAPDTHEAYKNVLHVNPHLVGIDGTTSISGSGVTYFFTNELVNNKHMAHVAFVGLIGDGQDKQGLSKLNQIILDDARTLGLIELTRDMDFYGIQTRPLEKLLRYSTNLRIPGITGDFKGANGFLRELGIPKRTKGLPTMMKDLTSTQKRDLEDAVLGKIRQASSKKSIFTTLYILSKEEEGTPFRDAKEFSTLLNSAGRLNHADLGIKACLGDDSAKIETLKILGDYKKEIVHALKWYKSCLKDKTAIVGKNYLILNAEKKIPSNIIGTLASIISKSGEQPKGTFIMSLARSQEDYSKVSLRQSGTPAQKFDLSKIMLKLVALTGGEAGGHKSASGAIISIAKEKEFIKLAKKEFESLREAS